eukprot:jgi/Picsp_1/2329/NSC_05792-R1_protein
MAAPFDHESQQKTVVLEKSVDARKPAKDTWMMKFQATVSETSDKVMYTLWPPVWKKKTLAREWEALRSEWRFVSAALCYVAPPLHILWLVKFPLLIVIGEVLGLFFAPIGVLRFVDNDQGVYTTAFGICSFALSLLLASRVNNVITRFNLARSGFGKLGNIMLTCCDDQELLQDIARWCVIYHNAIRKYLEGNLKLCEDGKDYNAYLHEDEIKLMHETHKMRQMAPLKIRQLISKAKPPLEMYIALNSQLEMAQIGSGDCVRIYSQSLPYPFTVLTTGFVQIWLYLLPLALKNTELQLQVALPASIFTALLLLGVDAAAVYMENPFKYMPLQDLCDSTQRDIYRALDEHKMLLESAARNAGKPPPPGALKAAMGPKGRAIPKAKSS